MKEETAKNIKNVMAMLQSRKVIYSADSAVTNAKKYGFVTKSYTSWVVARHGRVYLTLKTILNEDVRDRSLTDFDKAFMSEIYPLSDRGMKESDNHHIQYVMQRIFGLCKSYDGSVVLQTAVEIVMAYLRFKCRFYVTENYVMDILGKSYNIQGDKITSK